MLSRTLGINGSLWTDAIITGSMITLLRRRFIMDMAFPFRCGIAWIEHPKDRSRITCRPVLRVKALSFVPKIR